MRLLLAYLSITIAACAMPPQTKTTYEARDKDTQGTLASGCESFERHGQFVVLSGCEWPQDVIELEYVDIYAITVGFK